MQYIFLLASERSGSNLISRILGAHSEVISPPTKHLVKPFLDNCYRLDRGLHRDEKRLIHAAQPFLKRIFESGLSEWECESHVVHLFDGTYQTVNDFFSNIFSSSEKKSASRLFLKELRLWQVEVLLVKFFPRSSYLMLVRDPRDFVVSWLNNPEHGDDIDVAIRSWKEDQLGFLRMRYNLECDGTNVPIVRYEDLISNAQGELTRLCDVLNLAFEPKMLEFYQNEMTQKNAGRQVAWNNLSKPLLRGNSGKFETELDREALVAIENECHQLMEYFGYKTKTSIAKPSGSGVVVSNRSAKYELYSFKD